MSSIVTPRLPARDHQQAPIDAACWTVHILDADDEHDMTGLLMILLEFEFQPAGAADADALFLLGLGPEALKGSQRADANRNIDRSAASRMGGGEEITFAWQKPVSLGVYMLSTYARPDDGVLDITCGSVRYLNGAMRTKHQFIGIEKDEKHFCIAVDHVAADPDRMGQEQAAE